jgi:multidrug efflux system outer membrane protein
MGATEMNTLIQAKFASIFAALLLAACAAPEFHQPTVAIPAGYKEVQGPQRSNGVKVAADGTRWTEARQAEQQPKGEWWRVFKDPILSDMVEEATRNNANLAQAAARVKQARAIAGIADADRSPQVGVNVGAQRSRSSALQAGLPGDSRPAAQTSYSANLTASYEVDLFGRVSAVVAAARVDADTASANYNSVLLVLQADVAQTYFRLRATDAELATLDQTVHLRQENVKVNQRRFDLGDIGEFDLSRAKTELSTSRAEAIGLQRQRTSAEHALSVLLGRPASSFAVSVNPLENDYLLPSIPAGLPSTLLERRPDITAAQRAMEASNARTGVARAAMFPALDIGGSAGGVAGTFANVFKLSGQSWLLGALLSMPVIDGGRNKANVTRSEAVLEESVAAYRQSVLVAFSEVEDNLAGLRILGEQAGEVEDAVVSARRSATLAQKLYDAGRSSYLDLLDSQRNLAAIERSAVQLRGTRSVVTVALIRSLGGGWDKAL